MPSIYHTWYCKTLLGLHRRECELFRENEPSLQLHLLQACINWLYPESFVFYPELIFVLLLIPKGKGTH